MWYLYLALLVLALGLIGITLILVIAWGVRAWRTDC